jgi:hypothetical protein
MKRALALLCLLLLGAVWSAPVQATEAIGSYLYEPAACMDNVLRGQPVAYLPQPGDIMLATDKNVFWRITHDWALAFEPHNSAIIVPLPDGGLGILEAGPNDTLWVGINPMLPHLRDYASKGPVWIRRRKTPPTPEQCAAMMAWAQKQNGKRFALIRLGAQLTPLRCRGPLRTYFMGGPHGDRGGYFCSELVTETCVASGLLDPAITRPSATYPHDLFFDWSYNVFLNQHPPLQCDWWPPARWTDCPFQYAATLGS